MIRKLILFTALSFCLVFSASAWNPMVVTSGTSDKSCVDMSGTASLIWECNSTTVGDTGFSPCGGSDGDTSATGNANDETITSGECVFNDTSADGRDYYLLTNNDDLAPNCQDNGDAYTVFVKFYVTTWVNDVTVWQLRFDISNRAFIYLTGGNDLAGSYSGGGAQDIVTLVGNNVSTGTYYIVRYRFKVNTAGTDHEISLFSATPGDYSSPTETDADDDGLAVMSGGAPTLFQVGNPPSTASSNFKIDYVHGYMEWRDSDPND